ncbi:peptide chain release factor N(5)-glutamine methyltransferase [Mycoplasma sp. 480]|uniref:peptide chain release factor N(5)-glutamine methyltransferase n=1 Tax=Mycoplasma sp. 480 TaxID=3440155 RepID=UPI003F51430C
MQDLSKRRESLLREKIRNNLPLIITKEEENKLKTSMPIQQIIGFVQMDRLKFLITDDKVLIPRYETEEVINESLKFLNKNSKVLDMCAGSGFIGLTIFDEIGCEVTLVDNDENAISKILTNIKENCLFSSKIKVIKSNLFQKLDPNEKYDLIISNPPYIPENIKLDNSVLEWENNNALFAKEDGNYFYKQIINDGKSFLKKDGILIFEISDWNLDYFKSLENLNIEIKKDINQKNRIVIIKKGEKW